MARPPMNMELFKRVRRNMLEEPRRVNLLVYLNTNSNIAPCGAEGCVAGWICALGAPSVRVKDYPDEAAELLNVPERITRGLFSIHLPGTSEPNTQRYAEGVVRKMGRFVQNYYPDQYEEWQRED